MPLEGTWFVKDGQEKFVGDHARQEYLDNGWVPRDRVLADTSTGRKYVDPEDVEKLQRGGGSLASTEGITPERARYLERERVGNLRDPWSPIEAAGAGLLRGQTLGLSDVLLSETGLIDKERLAGLRDEYSKISLGTEITGALTGALAGRGPVGAIGKLGEATAKKAGGGLIGSTLGGAAEGFVFGGAQAANNMYLEDKPFSAEAIITEMGSGALFGGALGGAVGLVGGVGAKLAKRATEKGLQAANPVYKPGSEAFKRLSREITDSIDDAGKMRQAATSKIDDLAGAARGAVEAAPFFRQADELAAMAKEAKHLDDVIAGSVLSKSSRGKLVFDQMKMANLTPDEIAQVGRAATRSEELTKKMAGLAGLEYQPSPLIEAITEISRQEGGSFGTLIGNKAELAAIAETLGVTDTSEWVADVTGSDLAGTLVNLWAGQKTMKVIGKKAGIGGLGGKQSALEAGARNLARYKTRRAASGTIGNQPAFYLGNLVGNLGRAAGGAKERISSGVGGFIKGATAEAGRKYATPVATAILGKVRFDPNVGETPDKATPFKQRKAELDRAMANPDAVAERVRKKIAPIAHIDPEIGAAMLQSAMMRIEFYHAKAPKNPLEGKGLYRVGKWEPPASEVARFARYIRAGEDPLSLLDDMAAGKVTPEAAEAVKTLYPTMYANMQFEIIEQLSEPGAVEALDYSKRVQLKIFFDLPTDPTLTDEFYATMQDLYVMRAEQAQQGNGNYSTPGAVSKAPGLTELPTAAQRIEQ